VYLTQCLHRALQQYADRPMTICADRIHTTTQVVDRVARLAGALETLGVNVGDRVGILSMNSDRFHETIFACWWMGAIAHPVNIRWSPAEMAYAINDSGTKVLLVDETFCRMVPRLQQDCPGLGTVVYCGDESGPDGMLHYELLLAAAEPRPDLRAGGDTLAFLLYSGGTTGAPKGVMISHQSLLTSLMGSMLANRGIEPGGTTLVAAPMFHIGALLAWISQVIVGGTCVFLPSFTAPGYLDAVQRHQVTNSTLVPVMVQGICDHPELDSYDLSSLRTITYGAAASAEGLLQKAMTTFPWAGFTQGYGMTETGVLTFLTQEDHVAGGPLLRSAGRATSTIEIAIVDPDGNPMPVGGVGEVVTRGDHVMVGYWGKPELTAQTVRGGWMHTGDAGSLDENGYLFLADRIKDMIITGGENVYSAEVERALVSHPAVEACAVIGVPDDHWGERVHGIVVLKPGQSATAEDIRAHAKELIAGYKVPKTVEFLATLPTSALGKILKHQLRSDRR
jgi:long-chain acyl-CoA synthetase